MSPHDASALAGVCSTLPPSIDLPGSAAARVAQFAAPTVLLPASSSAPPARRIALLSDAAAPLGAPGAVGADGHHIAARQLARALGRAGVAVDLFCPCATGGQRPVVDWQDNVRVIAVVPGRAHRVPQAPLPPHAEAAARSAARFTARFTGSYSASFTASCTASLTASIAASDAANLTASCAARFTPRLIARLARLASRQPALYQLVHASGFASGMIAAQLKRTLGLPFIVAWRGPGEAGQPGPGAIDLADLGGAAPARIMARPCGFSPDEFWPAPQREARARLHIPAHRFVVLHAGRLAPHKGIDSAIQAVAMLRQRHGVDAELLVVGGERGGSAGQDGVEQARLRQLAVALGIGQQVRFEGARPHAALCDYYAAADVLASTPWCDASALAPAEAMACARVVVGTEVGGVKDVVLDGITGYLVPPRDPAALADRLARLQRQPERARHMGQLGRVRVCEHYTWRRVAQQFIEVYSSVLEETRASLPPLYFSQENA